jgi:nitrogen fixation-related uncharacterized protein
MMGALAFAGIKGAFSAYRVQIYTFAIGAAIVAAAIGLGRAYSWAYTNGQTDCQRTTAVAALKAQERAAEKANQQIAKAQRLGNAREQGSRALDAFFKTLTEEASHAPPAAIDLYVLPAARLRAWNDANAGYADSSAPTSQPDPAPTAAAPSSLGQASGLGGQPPRGSAPIPPASPADVPAAELP